jgi:hypothetical protein
VSTKNSLKNRIKKANATQAFFNSYESDNDDSINNKNDDEINVVSNNENDDNIHDIDNNVENRDENKTYINNDNNIDNVVNDKYIHDVDVKTNVDDTIKSNIKSILNIEDKPVDNSNDNDYLRELALGKKPKNKKAKKVFTSFYMDPDLAAEVDRIASRGEKGDKSKLINMGIRKLLEDYGVIETR